ncbi:hypothetical protein [Candidatus Oscillochloris fontis]|uniref:hypothetical protein n=1 Tax=Candidatus Oscillochloris fontis TaxID=2496868 RepID=UPI00101CE01F|nr:hypothetical protein [Candidatus Oscillochloris fontis]
MSTQHVKKVVQQFIAADHNDLLVLKGGWGVGKTYFWQNAIITAKESKKINKGHYSYVSLFGINSLEELRNIIMATREDANNKEVNSSIKNIADIIKQFGMQAENIPALREFTGGIASQAVFMLLKNTLICFDDLERRGDGLNIKDLMGFASLLTEQRNCQVVIIINEGSMSDLEVSEFRKHSEKIVDVELQFSPSSEEVFNYVFPENYPHYLLVQRLIFNLNIRNIRIIQRIKRFISDLLGCFEGTETEVIDEILRSIILFVWCYYDKDSGAPPLSYVKGFDFVQLLMPGKEKEVDSEKETWNRLLNNYGYRGVNDLNRHLITFVETGYLDSDVFKRDLSKRNNAAKVQQGQDAYAQVWKLYHNSFDNNEEEFVHQLLSAFRLNSSHLSLSNLQNTAWILRKLGHQETASSLIKDYILLHQDVISQTPSHHIMFMNELDDEIMGAVNNLWGLAREQKSLLDVIRDLASKNGWNPDDIEVLAKANVEDYYQTFKTEISDSLYYYIRSCLQFKGISGTPSDDKYKIIIEKVEKALRLIASESKINRLRISNLYKIEVDLD